VAFQAIYVSVGCEVLTAVVMKSFIFWDITAVWSIESHLTFPRNGLHGVISQKIELFDIHLFHSIGKVALILWFVLVIKKICWHLKSVRWTIKIHFSNHICQKVLPLSPVLFSRLQLLSVIYILILCSHLRLGLATKFSIQKCICISCLLSAYWMYQNTFVLHWFNHFSNIAWMHN
jgi:hypothetical protein